LKTLEFRDHPSPFSVRIGFVVFILSGSVPVLDISNKFKLQFRR
jgi:hypothetical protein